MPINPNYDDVKDYDKTIEALRESNKESYLPSFDDESFLLPKLDDLDEIFLDKDWGLS